MPASRSCSFCSAAICPACSAQCVALPRRRLLHPSVPQSLAPVRLVSVIRVELGLELFGLRLRVQPGAVHGTFFTRADSLGRTPRFLAPEQSNHPSPVAQ
jgi:hypothetical protein